MAAELPLQFKFIVIGSTGTGKTSIVRRLCENKFVKGTQSTVGIEYFTNVVNLGGRAVKMMIWDTAGQERFYTIAKAYFRGALGVILVFDITDRKTFDGLPRWLRDARQEADPHCTVMLVGNKVDLAEDRVVSQEDAEDFAKANDMQYIETSAAKDINIKDAFHQTAADLMKKAASGVITAGVGTGNAPGAVMIVPPRKTPGATDKICGC
jgi:small GTP-binding protein